MADTTKVKSPETTAVEDNQQQQRITTSSPTPPPPSHWMGMRYPSQPIMMPHHMMYAPPPFSPFHHHNHPYHHHNNHHQSRVNKHQNASNAENKTIWIGDLLHWMDENYLNSCFAPAGEMASVKVIRNKHTGLSEGYGFVEFDTHDVAEKVLQEYNGATMLKSDQPYRLNWASFSTGEKRLESPDHSIFVGDLAPEVTDDLLHKLFLDKYPSVKTAKVVIDGSTGRSKGYGFVRFGDDGERSKAMSEMNGVKCCSRAMRIGAATPRKPNNGYHQQGGYMPNGGAAPRDVDSLNTTIFVGGLDANVTDEDLRQPFAGFGEIVSVKIPIGKGCGFIQFVNRENAEEALEKLNGSVIGKQTVRLSWGRNQGNKQPRGGYGDQWVEPFYRGQYYNNGYGYMLAPPVDPRMYGAAPYGAYPMYGGNQQQQQVS
ncbi:Polyadenylate-binding protein RBP47C [Raphanus sativus]|uniref:Polyadenylate-binding protein RBP47C n=1 Tax=Raphanus sativus TaxID=3726 RepID=A0A6J0LCT5_RAPSA|nr:polyadenylate-binding protein RBP47C [Raphanus sativus]KAJ4878300.1 Polyadenylate-binding protein RBP47C [Raphanus sativus]